MGMFDVMRNKHPQNSSDFLIIFVSHVYNIEIWMVWYWKSVSSWVQVDWFENNVSGQDKFWMTVANYLICKQFADGSFENKNKIKTEQNKYAIWNGVKLNLFQRKIVSTKTLSFFLSGLP